MLSLPPIQTLFKLDTLRAVLEIGSVCGRQHFEPNGVLRVVRTFKKSFPGDGGDKNPYDAFLRCRLVPELYQDICGVPKIYIHFTQLSKGRRM